jgi:hypothetical protein
MLLVQIGVIGKLVLVSTLLHSVISVVLVSAVGAIKDPCFSEMPLASDM